MMRSASVLLPWSMWAMMEKLRMCFIEADCIAAVPRSVPWRGERAARWGGLQRVAAGGAALRQNS
jgi:hypothetical protein